MRSPDIVIAGAGIIGLACALECRRRGLRVTVLDKARAGQEASRAAAGMLAAHDPANPAALRPLSERSLSLYPGFLQRVAERAGVAVPIETEWTLERVEGAVADAAPPHVSTANFRRIAEQSLNPRKLTAAVCTAARNSGIDLREGTPVQSYQSSNDAVAVQTEHETIPCERFLDCTGAWSTAPVRPAKGQMLRLHAPGALAAGGLGNVVVRSPEVYLVPRLDGSVVVGATVEDAGFDKTLHDADLQHLRMQAAGLVPALLHAPALESWAGLRPATPDQLPLIGLTGPGTFLAAGHFRNGVLLAPATAHVVAQLLLGEAPGVSLDAFEPGRFATGIKADAKRQGAVFAQV